MGASRGGRQRLPRERRLTRGTEIKAVFRRGKRSRTAHLDVFDSASPVAHPRVGVIVPRYRQTVVRRNRVKRRLRELLRREVLPRLEEAGLALDVLVRARREAYDARFTELREELERWTDRRLSRAASSS
ncbi:MAG TPA: ribonuclease P protein component [Longimicrobiales bacterium]|nr:ribonuclease P protein component [Longimicrobiales bacterium]